MLSQWVPDSAARFRDDKRECGPWVPACALRACGNDDGGGGGLKDLARFVDAAGEHFDSGGGVCEESRGAVFEVADAIIQRFRAGVGGLRVEFVEDGEAGGEEEALGAEVAQGFDELFHALVEARAEFLEPCFLAGSTAERIALSGNLEFCLGHDFHPFVRPTMTRFERLP